MIFNKIIENLNKILSDLNKTSQKLNTNNTILKTSINENTVAEQSFFGESSKGLRNDHKVSSESLLKKWVYSTNHKYIGILYLIFGLLMGIVGATFSLMIRLELLSPGHVFF